VLDRVPQLQTEVHPDRFAGGSDAQKRLRCSRPLA
jgi:hypothetical protein